jgi:ferredoxin
MHPLRPLHGQYARSMPLNWASSGNAVVAVVGAPTSRHPMSIGVLRDSPEDRSGYACIGCAMCSMVCPNDAIISHARSDEADKLRFHVNRGGQPRRRGGRRNDPWRYSRQIKFIRISMLTDPALDAGRHEFELRTLLGRILPPEQNLKFLAREWLDAPGAGDLSAGHRRHVLRCPFSQHVGRPSTGGAYLNEELGMPVRMCTGEGGCPPRLLRSGFSNMSFCRSPAAISAGTKSFTPCRR